MDFRFLLDHGPQVRPALLAHPATVTRKARILIAMLALALIGVMIAAPLHAQDAAEATQPPREPIQVAVPELAGEQAIAQDRRQLDALITQRLHSIYSELDGLNEIEVLSQSGVVTLKGEVANGQLAQEAVALAERVEGVILVRDQIERLRDLESNLSPALEGLSATIDEAVAGLPLLAVAFGLFLLIALVGHFLARWKSLWRTVLPNIFLAELVAQAVRVVAIILGLVSALSLVGANALMGTVLGGAGVVGIAIGFAVRDTLENYLASIMLSLRQPFRSNDHVVIGQNEGIVMRLTSRATILMTLDGNHLRIPNADVFKGTILNYTRNPERRFDFALGIDAEDDPARGIETGVDALVALPFVLSERGPFGAIEEVGDSSIILRFYSWVDQRETDFLKARSLAIRAAKDALETSGFTLPEPIYRLRFDQAATPGSAATSERPGRADQGSKQGPGIKPDTITQDDLAAVAPDQSIKDTVEKERAQSNDEDLLDGSRPVE